VKLLPGTSLRLASGLSGTLLGLLLARVSRARVGFAVRLSGGSIACAFEVSEVKIIREIARVIANRPLTEGKTVA
jgi:uncharacterized protein (DUF697 family)